MSEVCWHCLHCHWYCDDVLEECRGQSEPCHEFKLCMEDIEKMQNKFEDRLVNVNDVIEAVDNHTREGGMLDEDISVILEEVKTDFDKKKVIEKLKGEIELCVTQSLFQVNDKLYYRFYRRKYGRSILNLSGKRQQG